MTATMTDLPEYRTGDPIVGATLAVRRDPLTAMVPPYRRFGRVFRMRFFGREHIVIAGTEYGSGSSRDWAAKGTLLLGVRAVLAVSFERIHRSNLIGMGVLPLQFHAGQSAQSLGLTGEETYSIIGLEGADEMPSDVVVRVEGGDGGPRELAVTVRIDTPAEAAYYRHGGILQYVLRQLLAT